MRPGIIATDMTAGVKEKYDQRIADGLIRMRAGHTRRVGKVVAMLLSGHVRYSTGR